MSDYNCTEWLVKNKAANALITFEKIVMVMINSAIFEKQLKALHVVHTFILTWSCLDIEKKRWANKILSGGGGFP